MIGTAERRRAWRWPWQHDDDEGDEETDQTLGLIDEVAGELLDNAARLEAEAEEWKRRKRSEG